MVALYEDDALESATSIVRRALPLGDRWTGLGFLPGGLVAHRLDHLASLVVTKLGPGFESPAVETLTEIVEDVAAQRFGALKFLILDFAHQPRMEPAAGVGFDELVSCLANLILEAPVVSIAWARAPMTGPDLECALACSMIVAEEGTRFSFAADLVNATRYYGLLAQKIGFARAERLMEGGEEVGVGEMRELLLIKDVAPDGAGFGGIESFLRRRARRHNASYGIYRAQRIAMPLIRAQRLRDGRAA